MTHEIHNAHVIIEGDWRGPEPIKVKIKAWKADESYEEMEVIGKVWSYVPIGGLPLPVGEGRSRKILDS